MPTKNIKEVWLPVEEYLNTDWTKVRREGDFLVDENGYVVMAFGPPGLGKTVTVMDTVNKYRDRAGLPRDEINIFKSPLSLRFPIAEEHGRACECYPCQQSNYRMNRDDPSVGGYDG